MSNPWAVVRVNTYCHISQEITRICVIFQTACADNISWFETLLSKMFILSFTNVTSNSGWYSFLKSPWLRCAENITLPKLRAALRLSCTWLSQKLLQVLLLELVKLQQQFRSIRSASSISDVTRWRREVIYLNRKYSLNSFKRLVFVLLAVRFSLPLRFAFVLSFSQPTFPILSYLSFLFTVILLSFHSSSLLGVVTAFWTAWAEYVCSLLVIPIVTRSVAVRVVLLQLGPVLPRSIKASISASIRWVSVPSPNSVFHVL